MINTTAPAIIIIIIGKPSSSDFFIGGVVWIVSDLINNLICY